ncbi:hypothetical protein ASPZODRAFT_126258 [Penicilliopsis zonata CBS 506.65]|uniref:RNase III domain-containing protein n=1 Tax=Penicilliopsis zonata CBS 506.65 TaxID=1073090 RepID=A0A1L9S4C3_9EURO|nr:hypothetical protein ASPZODRAFT_126258 [Penicilliopsis zonata CBS 506.65]OJJ41999.1 hypothetical protein ASPZODRAFT_126258 [Penicilliopsis zonata CBS 506.65]
MKLKRKTGSLKDDLPDSRSQKKSRQNTEQHVGPQGNLSSESALEQELDILKHALQEFMDKETFVEQCLGRSGPDVLRAVHALNKAINQPNLLSPSIPAFPDNQVARKEASAIPSNRKGDGLPTLPYITDPSLRSSVFTHPGVNSKPDCNYDRLEVLGDAYIELIATKMVWNRFPNLSSGRISQIREALVKNETLSSYADLYGFIRQARIPRDYFAQPKRLTKTKSDIFEAYVAAIVLSDQTNGHSIAEAWLSELWMPKIEMFGGEKCDLRAKESLAQKVMGRNISLSYIDERPPLQLDNNGQTFFVGVYLTGWGWTNKHLGSGEGRSKTIAGNAAAKAALDNKPLIDEIVLAKAASLSS